jgi:hypothetical protein
VGLVAANPTATSNVPAINAKRNVVMVSPEMTRLLEATEASPVHQAWFDKQAPAV